MKTYTKILTAFGCSAILSAGGIGVAAIANASIPDSSGVIHGCYRTSGSAKGALRVIDASAGQTCPAGTAPLNWRVAGGSGLIWKSDTQAVPFGQPTGTYVVDNVYCPSGYLATGGGYAMSGSNLQVGEAQEKWIPTSSEVDGGYPTPTGWGVAFTETGSPYVGGGSWLLNAYVVCAPIGA